MRKLSLLAAAAALALTAACDTIGQTGDDARAGSPQTAQVQVPPTQAPAPLGTAGQTLSQQDQLFAQQAALGGLFEVESSRLALDRSRSEAVQGFARRMIQDHTQVNQQLMQVAQAKGLNVPTELQGRYAEMMQELQQTQTGQFDRRYIAQQVEAHQEAAALFQRQANMGQDPDLTMMAQRALPVLNEHLQMAQQIAAQGAVSSR